MQRKYETLAPFAVNVDRVTTTKSTRFIGAGHDVTSYSDNQHALMTFQGQESWIVDASYKNRPMAQRLKIYACIRDQGFQISQLVAHIAFTFLFIRSFKAQKKKICLEKHMQPFANYVSTGNQHPNDIVNGGSSN